MPRRILLSLLVIPYEIKKLTRLAVMVSVTDNRNFNSFKFVIDIGENTPVYVILLNGRFLKFFRLILELLVRPFAR